MLKLKVSVLFKIMVVETYAVRNATAKTRSATLIASPTGVAMAFAISLKGGRSPGTWLANTDRRIFFMRILARTLWVIDAANIKLRAAKAMSARLHWKAWALLRKWWVKARATMLLRVMGALRSWATNGGGPRRPPMGPPSLPQCRIVSNY